MSRPHVQQKQRRAGSDYCQYAKVKCGKIAYSNVFLAITVAVKVSRIGIIAINNQFDVALKN